MASICVCGGRDAPALSRNEIRGGKLYQAGQLMDSTPTPVDKPSAESTQLALADLRAAGVDVSKVKVEDITKGSTH